jgi:hypothetical protein
MKREKSVVLLNILKFMSSHKLPSSISEISIHINSNWDTTNTNLNVLINMGYVEKQKDQYKLIKSYEESKDTFFGIPMKAKDKKLTQAIFATLQKNWKKQSNKPLNKTRAHKYAVNIANEFNLELPALWYKYGKVMLQVYDPKITYNVDIVVEYPHLRRVKQYAKDLIIQTKDKPSSYLKQLQYAGNRLYSSNTEFCRLLAKTQFSADHKLLLKDLLYKILFSLRKNEYNREKIELINAFAHLFIRLLKQNASQLKSVKSDIIKIYGDIWNLVVLMNAYESLIECDYPKEFLDLYIDFDNNIEVADQSLCELKELAD